jgi:hypothetical protein
VSLIVATIILGAAEDDDRHKLAHSVLLVSWPKTFDLPVVLPSQLRGIAAVSGASISRSDLASAGLLRRELDAAEVRVHRLREAARQRGGQ